MHRATGLLVAVVVATAVGGCATTIAGTPSAAPGRAAPPPTSVAPADPPSGTATLDNPTVATARTLAGVDLCTLLTPEDVAQATGLTQDGLPRFDMFCTIEYVEGGLVFVSDLGAAAGAPAEVGGNSALLVSDTPGSCQVTVALGPDAAAGNVLEVYSVVFGEAPVPVCDGVLELARRALDRLPPA